jgi:imidazolonepropionase-like amidohydrolase
MCSHRIAFLILFVVAGPLSAQDKVVIKGGRILTVSGAPIENGVIVISKGKIEAVGKDVAIPSDARVIDATGKVVAPGFVDVHTTRGMDQVNETNPNVPFLSVVDAIDPSQDYFEECRRQGITTVAIVPGNSTMFGGQAAILKTAGNFVDEMIAKRSMGIKLSLRPTGERNRMGHIATIRKELDAARDALADKSKPGENKPDTTGEKANGEQGAPPPDKAGTVSDDDSDTQQRRPRPGGGQRPGGGEAPDAALVQEALGKLLRGDMLAFIYCELAMDVPQAIKLAKDYKLKAVLVLDQDCHKAVKQIAAAKLPVVLDSTLVFWETDPRTGDEKQISLPRVFREAGVPVMFQVTGTASAGGGRGGGSQPPAIGANYLWYQAATAVKYGTPADEALNAITQRPAQTLGMDKALGTIEPGKDADLVILTGDPLKLDTWVETTLIGGMVVYERDKDKKLKALLKPEKQ